MNAKLALCAILAALASGCANTPTWDASVFPPQPTYAGDPAGVPAAEAK